MSLVISNWYGRLGNNLYQLQNCILISLFYKYNIIIPKHKYCTSTILNLFPNCTTNHINGTFYYRSKLNMYQEDCFSKNILEMRKVLKNITNFEFSTEQLEIENVVIHIRSGDIFKTNGKNHPGYIVPPMSYYTHILNKNKYKKIYIVAENSKNPCIDELLKLYDNAVFKKQNLTDDIKLICSAQNLICSFGSFVPNILQLTEHKINVYVASHDFLHMFPFDKKELNIEIINCDAYKNHIGKWVNSLEQIESLMNYNINNQLM